jgi:hypothetical protein
MMEGYCLVISVIGLSRHATWKDDSENVWMAKSVK